MLRTIRLTTAFICFTLVTLLFLDFTGTLHTWFGMAGENTVPAGGIGTQPRRGAVAHCIDLDFRSGLLLCNLPSRYIPGCRFMAGGETEEKSFPVFPRLVLVKIRGDGDLYPCHDQWVRGMGGLDRTLQRLRRIASNLFAPLWQWGTTFWPTWRNGRAVMLSTRRKSGYGASQPLSLPQLPSLY